MDSEGVIIMALCSLELLVGLLVALPPGGRPSPDTAADVATLRDGKILLGQAIETASRGSVSFVVRRSWALARLPEWAARWEAAEAPSRRRALAQRRERLLAWRKERVLGTTPDDAILAWIDREIARLSGPWEGQASPLLVVKLARGELKSIVRRPKRLARKLRQGWLMRLPDVEEMTLQRLDQALEDRGFDPDGQGNVSIEGVLPLPVESDAQWLIRRAATEVSEEQGLRFLSTRSAVIPEPLPGQPLENAGIGATLGGLRDILDENPTDPLAEILRKVAGRHRVGALVTGLEMSSDLATVRVESTLWVRSGPDRWVPAGSRSAVVRPDELARDAGQGLAEDPQVKAVFALAEAIAPGQIPEEVKRRSLSVGAATQKALGQVRSASLEDLAGRAFPVHELVPGPAPAPPSR